MASFIPAEVRALLQALAPAEARLVGGAVRAFVLGQPCPADVDVATVATPDEATARLEQAGYTVLPTGLAHGTVTIPLTGYTVELTTLRQDTATDGRHAEVRFTTDWQADSNRRDFTMNALYLDAAETLYDWHNGVADLKARQVRFVGEPKARVQEDYLRLLRYCRFAAHIGLPQEMDAVLDTLQPTFKGLAHLSAERVSSELFKLLAGPHVVEVLVRMRGISLLKALDLMPHRLEDLEIALHTWPELPVLGRWYIAFGGAGQNPYVTLSNQQKSQLKQFYAAEQQLEELGLFPLAAATNKEAAMVAHAMSGKRSAVMFLANAEIPVFPLAGQDVLDLGVPAGPKIGMLLTQTETWWLQNNLPDRQACLHHLTQLVKF